MPAEPEDPAVLVPLEPADGGSATVEMQQGTDGPRKRWWLAATIVAVLLVAAVAVNSQLGTDRVADADADAAEAAEDVSDESADGSPPDDPAAPEATTAESETPAQPEPDPLGDERAGADDDPGAESLQVFGEPEHPVSGVEPYIPSRVRPVELGPPAEVCTGTLVAKRIQLPLRFASTKPEGIEQLTWSPDCRRVVFRIGATLWLADGDGTGDMPFLTAQHGLNAPVWSPDSQWIAFSQDAIVEGERASHIFIVLPDGLGLAQITHGVVLDQDPAWSPDESRIAFARRVRVTEAGGDIRFEHHIVVADLLSGAEQVVSASAERFSAPSWSPDGGAIAYRVGGDLRAVRLDDLSHSTLLVGVVGGRGSWSRDGSRVAAWRDWRRGRAEIAVLDRPGLYPGDQHVIALEGLEQASPSVVPRLQWSADGERLLFLGSDTPASHWAYSIVVPRPARSVEYWAMLDVAEAVVRDARYEVVAVQHSVAVEPEFSVRGRAGEGVIEVWIAFERSEPRRFFEAIENPHSELPGIRRSPERIGVWFRCGDLYGEVLASSQVVANALAVDVLSAACPAN
ncbi:TolB family protein [Candidatus Poriferisodalis sp.]|uniref:TolB family protein n=1 Tax=Candidatus Poriferisodalis sp. TaxID=3101277 RepID=UPI003B594C74